MNSVGERVPPNISIAVIVITWNRPEFVRSSLQAITTQTSSPRQIIVVDASKTQETRDIVRKFPTVTYLNFVRGAGHMTAARNAGLLVATNTDVVAFLDDDAYPAPYWAEALQEAYEDATVYAAVGRTVNEPLPAFTGGSIDLPIGRFQANGLLTSNFDRNIDQIIDVDHGIGANMSFRRSLLTALGGFYESWPGTAMREDTDMFLRVRRAGVRSVFVPNALATHIAAPHVRGRRFDHRYDYYANRNHVVLLARHHGLFSLVMFRWTIAMFRALGEVQARNSFNRVLRQIVSLAGAFVGCTVALVQGLVRPASIYNTDQVAHLVKMSHVPHVSEARDIGLS